MDSLIVRAMAEGYWAARAVPSADSPAKTGWERGPLFRLRTIDVRDERGLPVVGFSAGEWSGEAASRQQLDALQAALRGYLLNHGFPFAESVTRVRADSSGEPAVDVELRAQRGGSFKLGTPQVRETRTRPETVRRLALWEPGEDYSPDRLEKGVRRLARRGYFESAAWTGLYRDPRRNLLYPVLLLPDAQANTVGGLLGYDTDAPEGAALIGYLDVRLVNIRGTARDFNFSFDNRSTAGIRERSANAAYTEPWILSLPIGARWEAGFLQQDSLFWEWNQSLAVFRDLGFSSRVEAEFAAQANQAYNGGEPEGGENQETGTRALSSGVRLLYDARDRVPFTRSGTRADAGLTGIRRVVADSAYYLVQARVAAERWTLLTERLGLKLGARAATNYPLNRLNRGELHDVGGARSLRGYREREFQTNAYLLGDAELQWSVGRRGRLFGFASPGLVNRPVGRYDARPLLGYGAGMEVARGDWSVALTYALNPDRSPGNGLLHAAVENRF